MGSFKVKKVLNNNVLIAGHDTFQEVVLIGKGIGFGKKRGELISNETVEKIFVLKNEQEQEQYKKLLPYTNEKMIEVVSDCIAHISKKVGLPLNEHIHIALTDHITFAIKRIEQGMDIKNPFLSETEVLYPKEYNIASEVVSIIEDKLKIKLPKGEIGFIALHIHSAITHKSISEVNRHSQLIAQLIEVAEDSLNIQLDKESFNYLRLVRHLQATIERVLKEEKTEEPEELALLLKKKYPLCYNVAWKMIKMMQQVLKKQIDEAEAVYLTMHLYRIAKKE
ncbi:MULTISPECIES: glucose PTS transporter transcription antiterminator GlcT [Aeribacillus]|jgi:transcriptional antiterminator|uniref:PtsGHI operon antiterminator n=2 Tax=Aeribacillus TaxID=1055323 RepID=A0A165WCT3_9BACI|nr:MULTISPECIES: PRD domain-containing protein [Aeribacillus]REJ22307.1 MAG: PRD domain-containing protein [Bacillaceae bacterium]ASS90817.1 PtsGHI operon antiterminator [Aeribacillus pallidus]KZN94881.1 PtsGHI operon antiterminator [Aeribacillus pallidus]MDR9793915.1 PRD domain-containing protein [Aeribacillus pallidus]MDR9796159.1 PRD domain-containing protein [Aeribacillus pallidus]